MATFIAFYDEAGIHDSASVTAVGGYVFDQPGYETFVKGWGETLLPFQHYGIEFFHAGNCYERKDQFKLLDSTQRHRLLRSLIALIRETATLGVISSLEEQAFATAIRRNKLRVYSGSKYTACALRVLPTVGACLQELALESDVRYLFESGYEYCKEANYMLNQAALNSDFRTFASYNSHAFESKRAQPAFQAADFFFALAKGTRESV